MFISFKAPEMGAMGCAYLPLGQTEPFTVIRGGTGFTPVLCFYLTDRNTKPVDHGRSARLRHSHGLPFPARPIRAAAQVQGSRPALLGRPQAPISIAKHVRHRIMASAARCAFRQAQFFTHFGRADHARTHAFDNAFGAGHQLFVGRQHALIQP